MEIGGSFKMEHIFDNRSRAISARIIKGGVNEKDY
jgi:hypothetical protein